MTIGSVNLNGDFFGALASKDTDTQITDGFIERLDKGKSDIVAVGWTLLQVSCGDALAILSLVLV